MSEMIAAIEKELRDQQELLARGNRHNPQAAAVQEIVVEKLEKLLAEARKIKTLSGQR